MILRLDGQGWSLGSVEAGHCSAATKAAVKCALEVASEFDSTQIVVSMLGDVVVLEGSVRCRGDDELAVDVAASIVGWEHIHNRLICRGFPKRPS
ncbi:BON domain-containing protein [Rhizobium tibeticum]|uniref:BON domain-containing protein n=1 Tax=Rhizobium tibeticum TaxID=501024 RepID=A0A1H8DKF0_9HYPH|nr:BON domain-containing protein [Rhizobium tibeticum]SEH52459.1 putative periplasmic or secreted lipoprotein [Rhizobium tibeticum]SEN07740.1 BON domain-containing protein [Rhizobium tibeticum]